MSRGPATAICEPCQFSTEEGARIRAQLDRLLASPQFRGSRRCQLLLQYVTDKSLAGDLGVFKERSLGIAVFGREPNYDTNQYPVVRATAAEVRKKLAQYYQQPEHEGEIRIALLAGSYMPEFHFPVHVATHVLEAPVVDHYLPVPKTASRRPFLLLSLAAIAVIAAGIVIAARLNQSPLERFWGRMLTSPGILVCLGQPTAYNLRSDKKQTEMMEHVATAPLATSQESIPLRDLVPMPDRYMAVGDGLCMTHIISFFERHHASYLIRGSASTTFADLREHPAVLIGAFDNEWTLRFGAQLRYTFYRDFDTAAGELEMIRDRDHPERNSWKLINPWPDWNVPADYAIISRVLDPNTDRVVVAVAGITQFGTAAAGEFLSNPDYFAQVLPRLPGDWPKKNLQIVLQVPVVHGTSGHPRVLATHVW